MKFLFAAVAAFALVAAAPSRACDGNCQKHQKTAAAEKKGCGCDHSKSKECKCEKCKCPDCPVHGKKAKDEPKKAS